MDKKHNPYMLLFYGLLIIVVIYLLNMNVQSPMKMQTGTYITGGSLDVRTSGTNMQSFPGQVDVKTDLNGGGVYLGGSRFAVIDSNMNSDTYGMILIYEYDEKTQKLNYLTTDNYVARMHQKTE
ncbi:hypothetical protein P4H66_17745 [Paenibacillus dokdonensis]|uniref:Uncharacterized protein n=2 Tax=Paenibacillus dokdonensis TaxID=2567944 RepID=A0ABU6GQK7_9BACL|nr:hypothetical protein [Paenibacillus dokdonensis]MEC0241664.1 hypothetical protein [Paenibacillus dokdonensis]